MLRMELPGKRKQGRHKSRFMDSVREEMALAQVTEDDAEIRPNGGGICAMAIIERGSERRCIVL